MRTIGLPLGIADGVTIALAVVAILGGQAALFQWAAGFLRREVSRAVDEGHLIRAESTRLRQSFDGMKDTLSEHTQRSAEWRAELKMRAQAIQHRQGETEKRLERIEDAALQTLRETKT